MLLAVEIPAVSLAEKEDQAFEELLELTADVQSKRQPTLQQQEVQAAMGSSSMGSRALFPALEWRCVSLRGSERINP